MVKIPIEERKLNQEQKEAVTFGEGSLLIIAGAGTGKTTCAHRFKSDHTVDIRDRVQFYERDDVHIS